MLFQTLIRKIDEAFPQQKEREEEKQPVIIIENYRHKTVMRFSKKPIETDINADDRKQPLSFFEKTGLKRRRRPRRRK